MSNNVLNAHSGFAGWYKFEALRVDPEGNEVPGSRRVAADWFPNLITNAGLDLLGTITGASTTVFGFCRVGSGNATPAVTDTALGTQVAFSSTSQSDTNGVNRAGTFYGWRRKTIRFAAGVAAGVLAEVGVSSTQAGALFSRALILNGGGTPTTITVLSDEVLDVTYELRCYPTMSDATGTVTISGTNYNWTARPLNNVTYDFAWAGSLGANISPRLTIGGQTSGAALAELPAQNAVVGSSDRFTTGPITALAYTAGQYARSFRFDVGLNDGNIVGGIGSFWAGNDTNGTGYCGQWAWGLSPKLPKTDQTVATFTIRFSWGRYTP